MPQVWQPEPLFSRRGCAVRCTLARSTCRWSLLGFIVAVGARLSKALFHFSRRLRLRLFHTKDLNSCVTIFRRDASSPRCRARRNLRLAATQITKHSLLACRCTGAGGPDRSSGAGPIGNQAVTGHIFSLCRYACRHPIEICAGRLFKLMRSLEGDIFKHENSRDSAGSSDPVWEHVPLDDALLADLNWMDGSDFGYSADSCSPSPMSPLPSRPTNS